MSKPSQKFMWSKLEALLRDPGLKRLGIALSVSAVLHSFLFGSLDFALPSFKKEMHLIEARLQMPKTVVKPVEMPKQEETLAPEPVPLVETLTEETTVLEPTPVPEISPIIEPVPQLQAEKSEVNSLVEEQPIDIGLVINENAYQYVETYFDVSTEINGPVEGKAKITFNLVENNLYQLDWLTEGSGFIALLFPDLLQKSEGVLTKKGLQPNSYLYKFGNKEDKTRIVNFDWQTKKVTQQTSKGTKTEELPEDTQDLLSFMYQFMYVAPLQTMQIAIANGKRLKIYDYSFEGEENINSTLGELKTMHIVHGGNDAEDRTELWLAIDYQFLPVKIRKIESNGNVVEMVTTRINTNRPTIN